MATNFKSKGSNLEDLYIRKDLFSDKGLWLWGQGTLGKLGDNTAANKSSPVQTISAGQNWLKASAGVSFTGAIKTDGTLWMWGNNGYGQLGNFSNLNTSSPVQTSPAGKDWSMISAGAYHTAAIKTNGTLWLWGSNLYGELGDNTTVRKSVPIQTVAGGENWKVVDTKSRTTAAIKTDGTLWLWGNNPWGQLGDNTVVNKSSPIQTISGGTNWKQVSVGLQHVGAIKTDGTLWMWGRNNYGQLGVGGISNNSSPIQTVSAGTNWNQVATGTFHTCAIKTDGTLWSWGYNNQGQLGDNTVVNKSSPIQTVSGGTNWKQVSGGPSLTGAIKTDGTLWLWGYNTDGQLGNSTTTKVSSPVQTVMGGTNWKQVSLWYHIAALN